MRILRSSVFWQECKPDILAALLQSLGKRGVAGQPSSNVPMCLCNGLVSEEDSDGEPEWLD
jgi:hypothetical protein